MNTEREFPSDLLENILPGLLSKMSENGKVLLTDMQDFYLASHGFPYEVAEELSALSAELAAVDGRRSRLLMNNLRLATHVAGR